MNKKELVQTVAIKCGLSQVDTTKALAAIDSIWHSRTAREPWRQISSTLRQMANGANYRLIVPNIHCSISTTPTARTASEYVSTSPIFAAAAEKGLRVLTIYPDEELNLWRKHLVEISEKWTVGHASLRGEKPLYDLRALPNLYLLDRDRRVILKDAPVEQVEAWLEQEYSITTK